MQETRSDPSRRDAVRRAIYVDIESLKTDPPHVAIVGVLTGSEGEDLAQLIVDPRLAPARVAKRDRLHVMELTRAVSELAQRAADEDRRIVAWSTFDRDRLIEACPDLSTAISGRYVNALEIGRRWRSKVHPGFKIERANQFSPKHTLDQYARLAGYDRVDALERAAPARWIRHTLRQLEANGGRYRRMSPEARRDWHRVLEYNRHDLLALRHIVLTAVRELDLWRAYERTRFCVDDGARRVCFKAGSSNARLDALLTRRGGSGGRSSPPRIRNLNRVQRARTPSGTRNCRQRSAHSASRRSRGRASERIRRGRLSGASSS